MEPIRDPRIYIHVRDAMAGRIRSGEFPAGTKLPILKEVAAEYGYGIDTAQHALHLVEQDGLAWRVPERATIR